MQLSRMLALAISGALTFVFAARLGHTTDFRVISAVVLLVSGMLFMGILADDLMPRLESVVIGAGLILVLLAWFDVKPVLHVLGSLAVILVVIRLVQWGVEAWSKGGALPKPPAE